jgi:anthranilate phosphoribosyltransferase
MISIFNKIMSDEFRELLKKVGSGQHTHKDLTRSEASTAMAMMLKKEATPAQIGAFMIAHRIKRPTGMELAGMLDGYDKLSTKISDSFSFKHRVRVFGIPYDGRSRTSPISPITALILATLAIPVIMHGGGRMPTKYGLPLLEIWQGLGIDFQTLSLPKIEQIFAQTGFTFFYTPKHFPLTQDLVRYRDEIGKRPPLSTVELVWSPYQGEAHLISGYVHPPTEKMIEDAFREKGHKFYTLVKGLEGSIDLRLAQTTIVAVNSSDNSPQVKYLKINPYDYNFFSKDNPLESTEIYLSQIQSVLKGEASSLMSAAIWNGGFYLWHCGICADLETGLTTAENLLKTKQVQDKFRQIKSLVNS